MRLTSVARLCVTSALEASKSEYVLVRCHSVATGYQVNKIRGRLEDKAEFVSWDPLVQREVLYKEEKKIKSVKPPIKGAYKDNVNFACMVKKLSTDPRYKPERIYNHMPCNEWFDNETHKAKNPPVEWSLLKKKWSPKDFNYSNITKPK